MADVDKLLQKNQARLDRIAAGSSASDSPQVRKKIVRSGPTRPWQENLPEYQEIATQSVSGEMDSGKKAKQNEKNTTSEVVNATLPTPDQIPQSTGQIPDNSQTTTRPIPDKTPDNNQTNTGHILDKSRTTARQTPDNRPTLTGHQPDNNQTHGTTSSTVDKMPDSNRTNTRQTPDNNQTKAGTEACASAAITVEQGTIPGRIPDIDQTKHRTRFADHETIGGARRLGGGGFYSVTGLKRKILIEIFLAAKSSGDRISSPIAIANLVQSLETSRDSIDRTLYRIIHEDKFISVFDSKKGRGGWVMYELSEAIYTEMVRSEMNGTLYTRPGYKPDNNRTTTGPNTGQNSPSSSSFYIDPNISKTTTSDSISEVSLPPDWDAIDYAGLREAIHFGRQQLVDIFKDASRNPERPEGLTAEQVQQSIYEFHYDITKNGKKFETGALNAFMGIVRKGKRQYFAKNYVSEIDRLLEEQTQLLAEREHKRQLRLQELYEIERKRWRMDLTREHIRQYAHDCPSPGEAQENVLRAYFHDFVWPKKKQDLFELARSIPGEAPREPEMSSEEIRAVIEKGLASNHGTVGRGLDA